MNTVQNLSFFSIKLMEERLLLIPCLRVYRQAGGVKSPVIHIKTRKKSFQLVSLGIEKYSMFPVA